MRITKKRNNTIKTSENSLQNKNNCEPQRETPTISLTLDNFNCYSNKDKHDFDNKLEKNIRIKPVISCFQNIKTIIHKNTNLYNTKTKMNTSINKNLPNVDILRNSSNNSFKLIKNYNVPNPTKSSENNIPFNYNRTIRYKSTINKIKESSQEKNNNGFIERCPSKSILNTSYYQNLNNSENIEQKKYFSTKQNLSIKKEQPIIDNSNRRSILNIKLSKLKQTLEKSRNIEKIKTNQTINMKPKINHNNYDMTIKEKNIIFNGNQPYSVKNSSNFKQQDEKRKNIITNNFIQINNNISSNNTSQLKRTYSYFSDINANILKMNKEKSDSSNDEDTPNFDTTINYNTEVDSYIYTTKPIKKGKLTDSKNSHKYTIANMYNSNKFKRDRMKVFSFGLDLND
jgi:hypothetical protein